MIWLVRHGETEWNRERRMQGRMESRLTPLGRAQAQAMADLLAGHVEGDGWRLVSSPLGRAMETAEAIATRTGLQIEVDERLAEIAFGEWEGKLRDEVAAQHLETFAGRDWLVSPPGGETYDDVRARVAHWLAEQPPEPERRVIAVSHGVTGRLLRGVYLDLSRHETLMQDVPQDAVFRLAGAQVERFDCAAVG